MLLCSSPSFGMIHIKLPQMLLEAIQMLTFLSIQAGGSTRLISFQNKSHPPVCFDLQMLLEAIDRFHPLDNRCQGRTGSANTIRIESN